MGRLGGLYVVAAAALWGTTGVAIAFSKASGLTYLQVSHLMILVSSCFLTLTLRRGIRRFKPLLVAYGALVVTSFRLLYAASISLNGVGLTSSLIYMAPLIVTFINSARYRALPDVWDVVASSLVFLGAFVATNPALSLTSAAGFAVGFLLALTYSVMLLIPGALYARGYSRDEVVIQPTISAAVVLTVIVMLLDGFAVSTDSMPYVLYGGVACMSVAVILFYEGLKHVSPVHAGLITTLEPVVSLILSRILLNEVLHPIQYLGAGVIVAVATMTAVKGSS
ncbi:MAG: DMT family transporter [Zestosphaera sp.]